jgi:hypothetical protein
LAGAIILEIFVTKADGTKQVFSREKVEKTCLRMGADSRVAYEVAEKIERRLHDGISTDQILRMIFKFMSEYKPSIRHLFDLRKGISLMDPKPEFEMFVRILLAQNGFEVSPNLILTGKCGEHEVDAIAKKNGATFFVEAKHHISYHTLTGLDESRIARAILEDVTEYNLMGKTDLKIDGAIIVTNTRYSEHARRYGECRNILQIGWDSPFENNLHSMIEKNKLYPLSCLRSLKYENRIKLVNSGVVIMKQLFEEESSKLARRAMIPQETLRDVIEKTKLSMDELWYS